MQVPSITLVPLPGVPAVRWLPGTTSLLLQGQLGLARVDLDTGDLLAEQQVQWTRVPELLQLGQMQQVCLGLVPGADRALLLVGQASRDESATPCLVLVCTSQLVSLGSWCIEVKSMWARDDAPYITLSCGWSAVAVCVGEFSGFQVHASDKGRLGELLFVCKTPSRQLSFSSCDRWLAGISSESEVVVLDTRTGCPVLRLEREPVSTRASSRRLPRDVQRSLVSLWPAACCHKGGGLLQE